MLRKLFGSKSKDGCQAALTPGTRVYAIGDIHGRLDLLDELLQRIDVDQRDRAAAAVHYVFLGDLVDRGPASSGVVERLRQFGEQRSDCHFLLGNHEEVFLQALEGDLAALAFFVRIGGRETILSYGISADDFQSSDYPELLEAFQAAVPPEHIAFVKGFEDMLILGDYVFVHAGVRPGEELASQRPKDLRWIRHEFLNHRGGFEKVVVHGHTISDEVEQLKNRIGLDTGAFATGRLSAMGFENDLRWVIQTDG